VCYNIIIVLILHGNNKPEVKASAIVLESASTVVECWINLRVVSLGVSMATVEAAASISIAEWSSVECGGFLPALAVAARVASSTEDDSDDEGNAEWDVKRNAETQQIDAYYWTELNWILYTLSHKNWADQCFQWHKLRYRKYRTIVNNG